MTPRVLIYRSDLLPPSETFIAAQAAALGCYRPVFAGLRRVRASLPLPSLPVLPGSAGERLLFQQTGLAPVLIRTARAQHASLVHAHFALDAAEALPLARALQLPLVVTLHGYDVMSSDEAHRLTRQGRLYLARRRQLWSRAALFLCVSNAIHERALTRGFPAHKLRTLPIGIDTRALAFESILTRAPAILFVGRLVEKKGCDLLLQAMARVQASLPETRLLIAGDGPERPRLEAFAAAHTRNTSFLGVQTPQQVHALMRSARCLAAPSITAANGDAEGLPTVLCEALALGLPVASTAHSGIPELIEHRRHGLLSVERDADTLARHLIEICTDDGLAERLRTAGRARVEQSFDLTRQTRKLEILYDDAVAQHHSSVLHSLAAAQEQSPRAGDARQIAVQFASPATADRRGVVTIMTAEAATERPRSDPRSGPEQTDGSDEADRIPAVRCIRDAPLLPQVSNSACVLDAGKQESRHPSAGGGATAAAAPAAARLRHQAAWLLSGSGAAMLFQALYFLLMGRMLGAREYGAFVGVVALVNVLSQFSSVGMDMVLLRTIARDRAAFAVTWSRALMISAAGFFVLLFAVLVYGHFLLPPALRQLLPYLALSDALFGKLTQLASRALQGADLARWSAKLLALTNAARAGAAALLFLWAADTHAHVAVLLWVRLYSVASLLVAIVSLALVTRLLGRPRWAPVRRAHLIEGLSFSFSSSAISVYNDIDKTLLVSHGMLAAAGIYAAAYRVVDVVSTPIVSLFAAASPRLFRQGAQQGPSGASRGARDLLRWAIPFGLIAAPLLALAAPALPRLFGHSFAASTTALRWLCLLPLLRGLHYAWGTAITACASQWLRTAAQASAAVLNLGLNLWLIPRWGWQGAAAASLLTDGMLALSTFVILRVLAARQAHRASPLAGPQRSPGGALQCSE